MSLKETKGNLLELLRDADNKVIALSGKWGTGKTHLWREVMKESADETVNGALCVSLFGLSSIEQVKRKLVELVVPGVEAHPQIWEGSKQALQSGLKLLGGFFKGFDALSELKLSLLAPVLLRKKFIVIDDIERKHNNLGVDEILGFINEYTYEHDARFVLILNDDQLDEPTDAKMWDKLREKVIDQELKLQTTPDEAFSIAVGLTSTRYDEQINRAVVICRLTNIRIIRKAIKATNRILGDRVLEEALLRRVVPSIVLFAAIHYKGIEDGPDFQFALNIGSISAWGQTAKEKNEELTEDEKRQAKWRQLMDELGIGACDVFEYLVVDFLKSGLLDTDKILPIVDRYAKENEVLVAEEKAKQFRFKAFWDYRVSEAELLKLAAELPAIATRLNPYSCTALDAVLADIPGCAGIRQQIIVEWINTFRTGESDHMNVMYENWGDRPLHQDIAAALTEADSRAHAWMTVVDVCMHIIENSGWGTTQEMVMRRATTADFETAIRDPQIEIVKWRRFMRQMLEMYRQPPGRYREHFGTATERFVEACRSIANDPAAGRQAAIIKRLFAEVELLEELELSQLAASPEPPSQSLQ